MDPARIDEVVPLGETEVWEVTNAGNTPHNFHVHGIRFAVVGTGSQAAPNWGGWKDTVYVTPGTTVRLVLRFDTYADPDSPYMFHCHLLPHEDRGMIGQFVVVRPGERPPDRLGGHAGHG